MKHKDFHLEHFARGVLRVKHCIAMCKLAPVERGSFYSQRFKRNTGRTFAMPYYGR